MLALYMLEQCVCLSVCLSQVGVLSNRLNGFSWFLARTRTHYPRHLLHYVGRKFGYLQNKGTSIWNFVPKLWTWPMSRLDKARRLSQVLSTNLTDHTEHPPLFTTQWAWRRASRGFVFDSWDWLYVAVCCVVTWSRRYTVTQWTCVEWQLTELHVVQ